MLTDGTEARATGVSPAKLSPFESRSEISWREPAPHIGGRPSTAELTCLEICAGGGGQSLGLEHARFSHVAAVEIDLDAPLHLVDVFRPFKRTVS